MKQIIIMLLMMQFLFATIDYEKLDYSLMQLETRSIKQKEKQYFTIDVPNGEELTVQLQELSADVDLYVSEGWTEPRVAVSDCKSIKTGIEVENCTLSSPNYVRHNIMVYGFRDATYKIVSLRKKEKNIPLLGEQSFESHIEMNKHHFYKINSKPGETVTVRLSKLTGDADLKLNIAKKVEKHSFVCNSKNSGVKVDECTITIPTDKGYEALTYIYIDVYGFRTADYKIEQIKEGDIIPEIPIYLPFMSLNSSF